MEPFKIKAYVSYVTTFDILRNVRANIKGILNVYAS